MKTKNMRKKALLSSVAMLLVAIVALSGATYAWWSANRTATVNGVNLTTNKSSSLLVAVKTSTSAPAAETYTSVLNLNLTKELFPVSTSALASSGQLAFFDVTQTDVTAEGSAQTVQAINSLADELKFIHKTLYFKADTTVSVKLTSLAATGSSTLLSPAIRVALINPSGDVSLYCIGSETKTYNGISGTGTLAAGTTFQNLYDAASSSGVNFRQNIAAVPAADSSAFVTLTDGAATAVELYIWLEGNDSVCNNALSGEKCEGLQFQFDVA